jgi:glycerate kinase
MRIVLAPDKFKGSLGAAEVCDALREGIARVDKAIEVDACPMADGGEGTVDALVRATGGEFHTHRVTGPLPEMKVDATFGTLGDQKTAVIEMSSASGMSLLAPEQLDPLATTTFGTGELINAAIELGRKRIILGIGGSATCDGGIGAAQACGMPIILDDGTQPPPTEPLCGRDVERVVLVKHGRGDRSAGVQIIVACDVTNPLYGPNGSAYVFGPQKGATPEDVKRLDAALRQLAQRTGHDDFAQTPGAGAAGGLGFGMLAFFGAALKPGVDLVIGATRLHERLRGADLCITGEGRIDAQSLSGKVLSGVVQACRGTKVPCIAIAGSVDILRERLLDIGILEAFTLSDETVSVPEAIRQARELIAKAAARVAKDSKARK